MTVSAFDYYVTNGIPPENKECYAQYLPKPVWIEIISLLDPDDRKALRLTCRKIREFSDDQMVFVKKTLRQLTPECENALQALENGLNTDNKTFQKIVTAFYQAVKIQFPIDLALSRGNKYSNLFFYLRSCEGESARFKLASRLFIHDIHTDLAKMAFEEKKLNILNINTFISSRQALLKRAGRYFSRTDANAIERNLLRTVALSIVDRPFVKGAIEELCKTALEKRTWREFNEDLYEKFSQIYGTAENDDDDLLWRAAYFCMLYAATRISNKIRNEELDFSDNKAAQRSAESAKENAILFLFSSFAGDFNPNERFLDQFETTLNIMKEIRSDQCTQSMLFRALNMPRHEKLIKDLMAFKSVYEKELALPEAEFKKFIALKLIEDKISGAKEFENQLRSEEAEIKIDSTTPATAKAQLEFKARYFQRKLKETAHSIQSLKKMAPEEYAAHDINFDKKVNAARKKRVDFLALINQFIQYNESARRVQ